MVHYMHLHKEPFEHIEQRTKTIELRLNDEKRQKIQVGDRIIFKSTVDPAKELCALVKKLHIFKSFAELYRSLPLEQCGYSPDEISHASPEDMERYYSLDMQAQYGVIGIEFQLL